MISTTEDFCNEKHIYFYCLNVELIYERHQFLSRIHLNIAAIL